MQEALIVRRETHVPAPPATVFAFLTDPDKILRWMGTEAQIEPHSGGIYLVNVTGARFARGSFREVVPVHRLAYSFGWDGSEVVPPGSSLVEIDLLDEQPEGTLLRLTHTGLPNAEQCAGHAEGWAHYLDRLVEVAAGRDPGPDPWHGRTGMARPPSRLLLEIDVGQRLPISVATMKQASVSSAVHGGGKRLAGVVVAAPKHPFQL